MRDGLAYERVRTRHSGAIISLAGDPFGGLLIPQNLNRVSGEPEPPLRGGYGLSLTKIPCGALVGLRENRDKVSGSSSTLAHRT